MSKNFFIICILFSLVAGCSGADRESTGETQKTDSPSIPQKQKDTVLVSAKDSLEITVPEQKNNENPGTLEQQLMALGFKNAVLSDTTIKVKLMYATENNFTHVNLYRDFTKCYLPPLCLSKLIKASKALQTDHPGFSFLIWDASRPRSIQRMMWDTLKMPFSKKINYLAHPDSLSLHNYGAALDLTVVNEKGEELDMGTGFDYFGELAEPRLEKKLLAEKKLTVLQIQNRDILRKAMKAGGYWPVPTEWWHFNAVNKKWAAEHMKLIE